ncbi:MAG: (Fe-S)-binding protein [Bacteroidales bacterium]
MGKKSKEKNPLPVFLQEPDGRLLTHLNACVRCGLCAESCLFYNAQPDSRNIPATKVNMVASLYRWYSGTKGKWLSWLDGAQPLTDELLNEMEELFFGSCTLCNRCTAHCSIGVDIGYIIHHGRGILSASGKVPDEIGKSLNLALETGNNMGITAEEFRSTLEWLEEDLRQEVNDPEATIPVNRQNAEYFYTLNPRELKFFPLSISAMARIFYAAGADWTFSDRSFDITNYSFYSGDRETTVKLYNRLADEVERLGSRVCVAGECGHGARVLRWEGPEWAERKTPFTTITSVELLARWIDEGRIRTDPSRITEPVTLHDPCNLVRNGGIIDEPRYILKNCVSSFVEMTPNRENNICCGGGGGMLAVSRFSEERNKAARAKVNQIKNTGAKIVVAPCHNCVDQLNQINHHYKLGIRIKTMAEIVADALVL